MITVGAIINAIFGILYEAESTESNIQPHTNSKVDPFQNSLIFFPHRSDDG